MVVAVTARFCGPLTGLPFELDATPIAIAATTPVPMSTQVVVFISACLTPAGLPGASGPISAARAAEAIKVDDKATAIKVRMFSPQCLLSFLQLYTKVQQVQRASRSLRPVLVCHRPQVRSGSVRMGHQVPDCIAAKVA